MKNKGRVAITVMAIMALAIFASSCKEQEQVKETLEQYITENESEKGFIEAVVADTMEISYIVQDESFTAEDLDKVLDGMKDTFAEIIDGLEQQTGIEGIKIQVKYTKPSGETITGKLFE